MTTNEPAERAKRPPLLVVFLTVFIDLLGFGIIIPLLPTYSKGFGASELTIGALFGSFSLMQFLFAPMWGRLSDRIGRRPVLLGGLVGTAASYVLFAFAHSLPLIFLSRILAGFFGANVSTAQAYIADVTTIENRSRGMGLIGAAFGLGFTLGPMVGGELANVNQALPGALAATLSIGAAIFGYFNLVEPTRHERSLVASVGFERFKLAVSNSRTGTLFLLYFLAIVAFTAFETMFTPFGLARFPGIFHLTKPVDHATFDEVLKAAPIAGRYLGGIGVLSALVQGGLIRRLVKRFGETWLVIVGPALLGVALLVIGLATSTPFGASGQWWVVLLGCGIMPFGFGLNNPALNGLVSRAAPASEQGAYLGLMQSVASLSRTVGPPIAGLCFAHFGAESPFFVSAGLLVIATLVAFAYRARHGASFAVVGKGSPTEH